MDAHDPQRHPTLSLLPGHPVRNRPHVDRRQHRVTQHTGVDQAPCRPDRLVKPHVLVHRQGDPRLAAQTDNLAGLAQVNSERFLSQQPGQVTSSAGTRPGRLTNHLQLDVRRHRHIEDLDLGIRNQVTPVGMHGRDRMPHGHLVSLRLAPRRNRNRIQTGVAVRHQLAVGHDETGSDAADSHVTASRQLDRCRMSPLVGHLRGFPRLAVAAQRTSPTQYVTPSTSANPKPISAPLIRISR